MWKCPICETNNEDNNRICEVCGSRRETPASAVIIGGEPATMRPNSGPAARPEPSIPDNTALLRKKLSRRNALIAIIAVIAVAAAGLAAWFFTRNATPLELRVDVLNADRINGVWYIGENPARISWSAGRSGARYNVSLNDPSGNPLRYYENTTMTELEVAKSDLPSGDSCSLILTAVDGKESADYRVILSVGESAPTEAPTAEPTAAPTPEPTEEPTPEPTAEPTPEPTAEPTPEPTVEPTPEPTYEVTAPEITVTGYVSCADSVYSCAGNITVEWKSEGKLSHYNIYVYASDELIGKIDNIQYTSLELSEGMLSSDTEYILEVESVPINGTDGKGSSSFITIINLTNNTVIEFKDEDLANAIRNKLDISGDISFGDLQEITSLNLSRSSISNLDGIEYCTNLNELYLHGNQIEDISPLSTLFSLSTLTLSDNKITDIHPISSLSSLTYITLDSNNITDISTLSSLNSLVELHLSNNQITDIYPLSSLTSLTSLHLDNNMISDIHPLSSLSSLNCLDLSSNQLSIISTLMHLLSLKELYLNYNTISDVSPLYSLSSLEVLYLNSNIISDISPLSSLTSLLDLHLDNNDITSISPLSTLSSLNILYLHNNNISDVSPLGSLSSLTELYISENQVSNISDLANLVNLNALSIDEYEIEDLDSISHLDCNIY